MKFSHLSALHNSTLHNTPCIGTWLFSKFFYIQISIYWLVFFKKRKIKLLNRTVLKPNSIMLSKVIKIHTSTETTIARNSIIVYYSNAILNAMLLKRQQLL